MKKLLLFTLLVLTQVLGDICLSRAMKLFGEVNPLDSSLWLPLITYLLTSPWIWLGIVFLAISLGLYLTAISRMDLSYVLPIHASSYIFNALLAWGILGEQISEMRWFSTLLIAGGVLLVGLSQSRTQKSSKPPLSSKILAKNIPFFLFPLGVSISKTWLSVIVIAMADASGDLLLAMGMKQVGKIEQLPLKQIFPLIGRIVSNPMIISGICCQIIAFGIFICALSWADVSFVRPATALTYLISLLGAKFILREKIARNRLFGIILIGFGVLVHQ